MSLQMLIELGAIALEIEAANFHSQECRSDCGVLMISDNEIYHVSRTRVTRPGPSLSIWAAITAANQKNTCGRVQPFLTCVLGCMMAILCLPIARGDSVRTAALSNQPAPGVGANLSFYSFDESPVINNLGQVAFTGLVFDSNQPQSTIPGLWDETSGGLQLVVRSGTNLPGLQPGQVLDSIITTPSLLFNNDGQTVFYGKLSGPGITSQNGDGIWTSSNGNIRLIARAGDSAAGIESGVAFQSFRLLNLAELNDSGQVAYMGRLTNSNLNGLWQFDGVSSHLVARASMTFGSNPHEFFDGIGLNSMNDRGDIVFWGGVYNDQHITISSGIFEVTSGNIVQVLREGDPAPGISGGTEFGVFSDAPTPKINNAGQLAFSSRTSGGSSAWLLSNGVPTLIAQEGHTSPAAPPNSVFGAGSMTMSLNSQGDIIFSDVVDGPNISSSSKVGTWIRRSSSNNLELVAVAGEQAPGMAPGVTFGSIGVSALNSRGQVAFSTRLSGPGVNASNDDSIWVREPNGTYELIARGGDQIQVSPGDFRTLDLLVVGPKGFNDSGQIAYRAVFTDGGQGIFVSNVAEVSEPSTMALTVVALVSTWFAIGNRCGSIAST
jgi:hypothetical protein